MKRKSTSPRSETDLRRLRQLRDKDIVQDSDNPAWSAQMFARSVVRRGLSATPAKTLLSLRIDADVVEWFRAQGPGYQSRMNALLRAYMDESRRHQAGE